MSFRTRVSILVAATAALTVAIAAVAVYFIVRAQMLAEIDSSLRDRLGPVAVSGTKVFSVQFGQVGTGANTALGPPPGSTTSNTTRNGGASATCTAPVSAATPTPPSTACPGEVVRVEGLKPSNLDTTAGYIQVLDTAGNAALTAGERLALPVTPIDRAVAADKQGTVVLENATVHGTPVRIATASLGDGNAVQVARPLTEVDAVLSRLRWILAGIFAAVVLVAGTLGRLVTRRTLRPVDRLMLATEHVAGTRDLRRRIEEPGDDELGRLAHSFNRMLTALDESERNQRQLVADASHELRTPLSSLRTNIEVLARSGSNDLPAPERERLLADVLGQLGRLTQLVADLIDLARGDEPISCIRDDVPLDTVVMECVDTARAHYPSVRFDVTAEPVSVHGDPDRIARAVGNLLDNAGKWSPPSGVVEVRTDADGTVTVRDHGPGIAPENVAHVFQRFWRAPEAKRFPGSGLGLAIVQQVAETHGGDVHVELPPDGGTLLRLHLPSVASADS
jgi:two-component system sensor histidine kinase MprB